MKEKRERMERGGRRERTGERERGEEEGVRERGEEEGVREGGGTKDRCHLAFSQPALVPYVT